VGEKGRDDAHTEVKEGSRGGVSGCRATLKNGREKEDTRANRTPNERQCIKTEKGSRTREANISNGSRATHGKGKKPRALRIYYYIQVVWQREDSFISRWDQLLHLPTG